MAGAERKAKGKLVPCVIRHIKDDFCSLPDVSRTLTHLMPYVLAGEGV